jgi:hypothetical protein
MRPEEIAVTLVVFGVVVAIAVFIGIMFARGSVSRPPRRRADRDGRLG